MRLKMTTGRVHASGRVDQWGDVVDVPDGEGSRMLKAGQAILVPDDVETAMVEQTARGTMPGRAMRKGVQ